MSDMNDAIGDEQLREIESELSAPFPHDDIHWRVGATNKEKTKGIALAYIDARHVMDRLDSIVGVAGWQREYFDAGNGKTCCRIGLLLDGGWVWKADGAGDTDIEGDKGAFSDAFKRAGVSWGIGRYLYALGNSWVALEPKGRSYGISDAGLAQAKKGLAKVAAGNSSHAERNMVALLTGAVSNFCTSPALADEFMRDNKEQLEKLTVHNKQKIWQLIKGIKNS